MSKGRGGTAADAPQRSPLRPVWDGIRLRCPACGHGRIYDSFTVMNPVCSVCGVVFEGEDGEFLGGIMMAYAVTAVLVAAGIFALEAVTDLTVTVHLMLWSAVTAVFLFLTYRNFKGLWLGIVEAMTGLARGSGKP